jgi:glycosyltransferase involved in cell wall biosynthesis
MKILLIYPLWGYFGGREEYLMDLVEQLSQRGHICSLIYEQVTERPPAESISKTTMSYQIPILTEYQSRADDNYSKILTEILEKESPNVIFLSDIKNFSLLHRMINFGAVVSMAHHGWLFCLRNSRTLYFNRDACYRNLGAGCLMQGCFLKKRNTGSGFPLRYNSLSKQKKLIAAYSKIRKHVVTSQYMKNLFLHHGFTDEQVQKISLYTRMMPANHTGSHQNVPTILFVGRIDRYKGVDFLLRALPYLRRPFHCNIVGDGAYLGYCRKLSQKWGLENKVTFLGWLPHEEISFHLGAATVVVVPSVLPEAFGIAGIEAMMYAKPVVGFNTGGISEWLKDGETGYLIPYKDIASMARKIDCLLENEQLANKLGLAGQRLVVEEFNPDKHFDHLIHTFEEASRS